MPYPPFVTYDAILPEGLLPAQTPLFTKTTISQTPSFTLMLFLVSTSCPAPEADLTFYRRTFYTISATLRHSRPIHSNTPYVDQRDHTSQQMRRPPC